MNNANGVNNSFFGRGAGSSNTRGQPQRLLRLHAGNASVTGFENAFFGANAGESNSSGDNNSFFGRSAGLNNTTGSGNTFIGRRLDYPILPEPVTPLLAKARTLGQATCIMRRRSEPEHA
jgi:hypothetical protein